MRRILLIVVVVVIISFLIWAFIKNQSTTSQPFSLQASNPPAAIFDLSTPSNSPNPSSLANPIADFKGRITKKFFGTFVTPQNSPVQPERFMGYHTGVDVEYGDVSADVPVYAISDGKIVTSEYASGYGGVFVLQFNYQNQTLYAIYGHIRPSSLPKLGSVTKNQQLAVLGTAYSKETDGERRHLHFGIAKSNTILGYVQNKAALSGWLDPMSLYP